MNLIFSADDANADSQIALNALFSEAAEDFDRMSR